MTAADLAFHAALRVLAVALEPDRAVEVLDGDEFDLISVLLTDARQPETARRFLPPALGFYAAAAVCAADDTGTEALRRLLDAHDTTVQSGSVTAELLDLIGAWP